MIGKETEEPKILLFICDVISSGPSIVWVKYFSSSETILLKWFSKSTRTEGSAFSFIVRLAEVCFTKTFTIPDLAGKWFKTSSVIRWKPLVFGSSIISFWYTTINKYKLNSNLYHFGIKFAPQSIEWIEN